MCADSRLVCEHTRRSCKMQHPSAVRILKTSRQKSPLIHNCKSLQYSTLSPNASYLWIPATVASFEPDNKTRTEETLQQHLKMQEKKKAINSCGLCSPSSLPGMIFMYAEECLPSPRCLISACLLGSRRASHLPPCCSRFTVTH